MIQLSQDLRPMTDLKTQSADVIRQASETGRPVVLTRHGRGVAVVLSVEVYDKLEAKANQAELRQAIAEGLEDIAAGRTTPHEDVRARTLQRLRDDGE